MFTMHTSKIQLLWHPHKFVPFMLGGNVPPNSMLINLDITLTINTFIQLNIHEKNADSSCPIV